MTFFVQKRPKRYLLVPIVSGQRFRKRWGEGVVKALGPSPLVCSFCGLPSKIISVCDPLPLLNLTCIPSHGPTPLKSTGRHHHFLNSTGRHDPYRQRHWLK